MRLGWFRADFGVKIRNAQGDMATVSNLVDAAVTDETDLFIAITTPALQAVLRRGGSTPIIFTVVSDGVAAGAGRTARDHRANVTGIDSWSLPGNVRAGSRVFS